MGLVNVIANRLDNKRKHDQIVIRCKNRILSLFTINQLIELHKEYIKPQEDLEKQSTAGLIVSAIITPQLDRQGYIDDLRKGLTLDQLKDLASKHKVNIKEILTDYQNDMNGLK